MPTLTALTPGLSLSQGLAHMHEQLSDLQRQMATGRVATTYGELGNERTMSLSMRSDLSDISGFQKTITHVEMRLNFMSQSLERMRELATGLRSEALTSRFEIGASGQTTFQGTVAAGFDEFVSLLNSDLAGRHLFSGRTVEDSPVRPAAEILEGVNGKAGFEQVMAERRLADMGADGRGRLAVSAPAAGSVQLAEDGAGHPFGFKLASVTSSLTGATVTGPAGSPAAIDVAFGLPLPEEGDKLTLTLDLPDGTKTDVTLTARTGAPLQPGDFQIGADAATTAANAQAALEQAVEREATVSLRISSGLEAADNFFDLDAGATPQRVDGPPFETATALVNADPATTLYWYEGELSADPARESARARIDDSIYVSHGARANEAAFSTVLKQFAVMATETFDVAEETSQERYGELSVRFNADLSFPAGTQSIDNVLTELTSTLVAVNDASGRHEASSTLLQGLLDDREEADVYEVSAKILLIQQRLQASYETTALISRLSLVNFI